MIPQPAKPAFVGNPILQRAPSPSRSLPRKGQPTARRAVKKLSAAREVVGCLPAGDGDSLTVMISYGYDPVVLLQVLIEDLSREHGRVDHLRVASLSTSKRCPEILASLIDAGKATACSVLLSEFQRRHDKAIFKHARETLTARGAILAAQRSHVKAWLLHFHDGRKLVAIGSANLRSSRNVELMTLSWDGILHDWLAAWIDEEMRTGKTREDDDG